MITKLYTVFLGLLIALFVGVGIAALYPGPKAPDYQVVETPAKDTPAPDSAKRIRESERQAKQYQLDSEDYNRNVSLLALGAAVILLAFALTVLRRVEILGDGLTLGAVFTLIYSIIRGFGSGDNL